MSLCATAGLTGAQFSTYRIGGPIEEAYQPETFEEAVDILQRVIPPITVLGWGSNLIVASAGIRGVTLITRKMTWAREVGETGFVFGAGAHLAKVSKMAEAKALTGAEYMIGIPGTVGGAVRMNAGALGQETSAVVRSVTLFNLESRQVETWEQERLAYAYRQSAIAPRIHLVLEVDMRFQPGDVAEITRLMEGSIQFRKTHHPTEPNGGSVFKNPYPKDSEKGSMTAGRMLDQLGAKTWTEGGVRVSPLHANFIVNTNNGTSTDLLRLMIRMKRAMKEHYGAEASPENLFVGEATPEEEILWRELTGGKGFGEH